MMDGLELNPSHESLPYDDEHSLFHNLTVVSSLNDYEGASLFDKTESLIKTSPVIVFGKSWCPFTKDAIELFTQAMCVNTHVVYLDKITKKEARDILKFLQKRAGNIADPVIFVREICIGGCQELMALHETGELERCTLRGLFQRVRALHTDKVETAKLAPAAHRDKAVYLPAWFPEHVNNHDVRLSSAILCILGIVSSALVFSLAKSARWIVFVMMIDQLACVLAGPLVSPIGAIAMTMLALKKPNYVPGACKQITALIGCVMTGAACIGFFLGYTNSTESVDGSVGGAGYSGCAIMAVMSIIWLVEMCYGVEVGKRMLSCGFRWRILPLNLYRMHTRTRQEAIDTWIYRFTDSDAAKPVHVESGSRENPLKLKYKKKVEEWSKDDFDPIRHIRITYFAMPASIAGLALTFKIGGSLNTGSTISLIPMQTPVGDGIIRIQDGWFQAFSSVAAFIFIFMMFLYLTKALLFFDKVKKEWFCPQQSSSFGYIFISCMIFGFLLYNGDSGDDPESDSSTQVLGRVLYWIGAVSHAIFSIIKIAEWICRRLRLDHVHANWTLLSVGLALAGFCTPIVGALAKNEQQENGNAWLGRFYVAFSQMVFTPIYVITFYKLLCFHNSDHRERHGWWLWVAAQCMLGLSEYTICEYDYSSRVQETILATPGSTPLDPLICGDRPVRQVAGGVLLFLMLCCATLPRTNFFFRDEFNMNYWIICFSLDILSAAASFFYTTNGWYIGLIAEMCTIVIAGWAHAVVFMHTLACLIRKHGVCTSADKWGPLSLIRIVHQAMRGNIPTLQFYLSIIDLDDASPESRDNLGLFAAHFNRFRIIHEEHSLHDEILFTAIRELFPRRGRKCEKDHRELNSSMMEFSSMINMVLDPDVALDRRKEIVSELKLEFPLFLKRYERHLLGEEYDMLPIGEKYIPVSWAVELVREMWKITPPEKWEVIIDFTLNNLPRQHQRKRFLKVFLWCMPERAQQIGIMVYRHVDTVMWEHLRCDLPSIVPRGLLHWKRYY